MLMLGRNQGQTGSSNGRNYEMSGLNGLRNGNLLTKGE